MPVLLAKRYSHPLHDVDSEIRKRLQCGDADSFLYVVPTKRKVRELQREFLTHVPGGVAPSFSLFTLETLAEDLYKLCSLPRQVVSGPMQAVLMQEAIRSVEEQLRYIRLRESGRRIPPGTFKKIIDVINHLRERGVYSTSLYAEIESCEEGEQPKLRDILAIYEAYEERLGTTFIDAAGIMKEINVTWQASAAPELFARRFRKCTTLFLSGFDEFSDPELTMIHHLSDIPGIQTVISFDYHLDNDDIFGNLKDNYRKLLSMGFEKRRAGHADTEEFQEFIAAHLFRPDTAKPLAAGDRVTLLRANDREHEVELIAKTIKHLVHEHPSIDLSRICVSMLRPEIYTAMFREVFERFGIPANITDRYQLDRSPLVVAILSVLELHAHHYRLVDIMRSLSTPFLDFTNNGDAIDPGNLYSAAVQLKISAGKKAWAERGTAEAARLDNEMQYAADETEEGRLRRQKEMILKAQKDFGRLESVAEQFRGQMSPREFASRLHSLFAELHVVERLIDAPGIDIAELEIDTRAYQKFVSFIEEFAEVLLFELKEDCEKPLSFYLDRLKIALGEVRYNVRQKYGYGVYVTSFDETRGLSFDVMLIAGLVDGELPPLYAPEILFSSNRQQDYERKHLRKYRYLFYQALTNFTREVVLTFPSRDGDLELVPSPFIDALCAAVELTDCRSGLPDHLRGCLYSHDEVLAFLGAGGILDQAARESVREDFEYVERALRVENNRLRGTPVPEYHGVLEGHLGSEALRALERFRNHVYSATQLEVYGKCPFRFFAEKVLHLNVTETFEEGLSPLERGSVFHDILFEFYTQRRSRELPPIHLLNESEFNEALNDLSGIAAKKLDGLPASGVFWDVEKEMILGNKAGGGVLQEFLEYERGRAFDTAPSFFEVAFGAAGSAKNIDNRLRMENPVNLGKVLLRGRIDRVDTAGGMFTIIDYKGGSKTYSRKELDAGMSLQIPLYLYAVEQIMKELHGAKVHGVAGIYYMLRSPVKERLGIGIKEFKGKAFSERTRSNLTETEQELRSVIDKAIAFVNDYVDSIARGEFPVAPKDPLTVCKHCDFSTICRIQLQQAK